VSRRIAFFDFDGTLTTRDTLLEFIKYSRSGTGNPISPFGKLYFYFGFLINGPWLIAYKLKIISNQAAKERILRFFFGGMPLTKFDSLCEGFAVDVLPGLIRAKAPAELQKLRELGTRTVIVSASPENWIRAWAERMGADLIATRLATRPGAPGKPGEPGTPNNAKPLRLTGKIEGINCHGEEKVRRIRSAYSLSEYDEVYAYGDSSGDRPMLALATISFFKPFR
jgi:phosphatidylglycerophosphatase C